MGSPWSDGVKLALSNFTSYVMRQLELDEWRLVLKDDHPDSTDAAADITAVFGQRLAQLRLEREFFEYPLDKIEHYLVHELCHLYSEHLNDVVHHGPEILLGKPAFTLFYEQYNVQLEHMTDRLAYVLVDLLRLRGEKYSALLQALKPVFGPPTGRVLSDAAPPAQ